MKSIARFTGSDEDNNLAGRARAKLGTPLLLPLAGLGIRSIEYAASREILSDDGARDMDGVPCKDLPAGKRSFRSLCVSL